MNIYDKLISNLVRMTILMCFARYTFIFLCRPVIIDTYTMIMDNSIIKFVRYDVIQLPGETIKD